jgi:4-hydroxybenzoate polyprenyltransferase
MASPTDTAAAPASGASDIPVGGWIDRWLPAPLRPYAKLARLDRPIGTWLLLFPGWWAIALATPAGAWPDPLLIVLFALGAVAMRGAGCTINDITDRDFDRRVARTALRPLASGAVSVPQALSFLMLQLAVGLAVLLAMNWTAVLVGAASLPLIVIYPFMKRITWWPQAFLGITFNWGALLGWAAATGSLDWPALALYAGGIAWTLAYDTIYAHQDKEDDALIGVKSTARLFGQRSRPWILFFSAVAVVIWALALALADVRWPGWIGLALAAGHLAWQAHTVNFDDPADCLRKFKSNRVVGWVLFLGLVGSAASA